MNIIRVATLVCFMMAPTFGWAGFITDRQSWVLLSISLQRGYVLGVMDQSSLVDPTNQREMTFKLAVNNCMFDMKLTNDDLVTIINKHYETLENWKDMPIWALRTGLSKVCKVEY